jgi:ketosteroid isomerase-like protein
MSDENVEIVRAAIDAYNRGDRDAALKDATPDFEMDLSRALGPQHGVYGLEQLQGFWREFDEGWESIQIDPQEFIEIGEHVVVPWTMRTVGRDGIEVEARVTWTFTIRDGAVQRITMYQEREEALEAAELPE